MSRTVKFLLWVIAVGLAAGFFRAQTFRIERRLEEEWSRFLGVPVDLQRVRPSLPFGWKGDLAGPSGKKTGSFSLSGQNLEWVCDDPSAFAVSIKRLLGTVPSRGRLKVHSRTSGKGLVHVENELTAAGLYFSPDEPTAAGPTGNSLARILQDEQGIIRLRFSVEGPAGTDTDWAGLTAASFQKALSEGLARGIQRTLTHTEQNKMMEEVIRGSLESRDH